MAGALRGVLSTIWRNKGKTALLAGTVAADHYLLDGAGRKATTEKVEQYVRDPSQIKRDFSGVVDAGRDVVETGSTLVRGLRGDSSAWGDFLKPDANGESLLGKLANAIVPMIVGALAGNAMGLGWGGALVMAGAAAIIWKGFLEDRVKGLLSNVFEGSAHRDPAAPSSAVRLWGPSGGPVAPMEDYAPG